jgi:transposase
LTAAARWVSQSGLRAMPRKRTRQWPSRTNQALMRSTMGRWVR